MKKSSQTIIHITPKQKTAFFSVREIWKFRSLLRQMIKRNINSRITNSPLTLVWGFIRPAIMTLAFFYIRRMANADMGQEIPYSLFIFSGLCVWFLFSETTANVAHSLKTDAGLSNKVYFPKILSPIAVLLGRWIDITFIVAAIIAFQMVLSIPIGIEALLIVVIMVMLLLLAFGFGILFSGLFLLHQDFRKIFETIIYLGLFLSPVIFSKEILPPIIQKYYSINPMVGILTGMRGVLFGPEEVDYFSLGVSFVFTVVLIVVGVKTISWALHNFEDQL